MAASFAAVTGLTTPDWFTATDPPGSTLGSGGGTANLLAEAWRTDDANIPFQAWLCKNRKLIVHAGGQSRRLPAYAAVGKSLIPIPVMRWSYGQRLDQNLLSLQMPDYERVFSRAAPNAAVLVASGDVLLRFGVELPLFPEADIVCVGMRVDADIAQHFGVFFLESKQSDSLRYMLQKPSAATIREHSETHPFLVDSGLWILSERAVGVLMNCCAWDDEHQQFRNGIPDKYELYAQFGLALGASPTVKDARINSLTCAIVTLPQTEFLHLGTSRQLIESIAALQNRPNSSHSAVLMRGHPDQIVQNSVFDPPTRRGANHTLWIENSCIPATWRIAHDHVLTGVPENEWDITLHPKVCLDFAPIGESEFCVRTYGIDDSFQGAVGQGKTQWLGSEASHWFASRGISWEQAGIDPECDIQLAKLFPAICHAKIDSRFLEWLFADSPDTKSDFARFWCDSPRLSAAEITDQLNLSRLFAQRKKNQLHSVKTLYSHRSNSVFYRLDLQSTARIFANSDETLPPDDHENGPLAQIHDTMWRGAVHRLRDQNHWETEEQIAFTSLRSAILEHEQANPVSPVCHVLQDQIIWGRSPARLDLAGGWTDTPPYCLLHGGKVTNLAVNLNGQPPIQVFAKLSKRHEIVIRSIDFGAEERISSYDQIDQYAQPGNAFALGKAALALAGFLPRYNYQGGFGSLEQQLKAFGGGIEISLLAAIPQGSGLGTSSILAATLLGTLSELCGLGWDSSAVIRKTLALEQMLTTGGGWQDQAGGILRGIKLVETAPGLTQDAMVRWLPDHLFTSAFSNQVVILYYTGLTRLAKSILQEIVRGMFLNAGNHLSILEDIKANAVFAHNAIQNARWDTLCEAVERSWNLNQRLDSGTNPPEVQAILNPVADYLSACKLLGAGGGGYLLMFAKDALAAERIREQLIANPPNSRARFVDITISNTGMEITRS